MKNIVEILRSLLPGVITPQRAGSTMRSKGVLTVAKSSKREVYVFGARCSGIWMTSTRQPVLSPPSLKFLTSQQTEFQGLGGRTVRIKQQGTHHGQIYISRSSRPWRKP